MINAVFTIWYILDGGDTWKPVCSDVTGESAGQFWLTPPTGIIKDMKARGFKCKIVKYSSEE